MTQSKKKAVEKRKASRSFNLMFILFIVTSAIALNEIFCIHSVPETENIKNNPKVVLTLLLL